METKKTVKIFPVGTSLSMAMLYNFPVELEIDGKLQPKGHVRGIGGGKAYIECEKYAMSFDLDKITSVTPSIFSRI